MEGSKLTRTMSVQKRLQDQEKEEEQKRKTESTADEKIRQNQEQVKEVKNIMQQNIEKALQRDVNLSKLESNVADLKASSEEFQTVSAKTKSHFAWKNKKWTIILIVVVICVLLALGLGLYFFFKK